MCFNLRKIMCKIYTKKIGLTKFSKIMYYGLCWGCVQCVCGVCVGMCVCVLDALLYTKLWVFFAKPMMIFPLPTASVVASCGELPKLLWSLSTITFIGLPPVEFPFSKRNEPIRCVNRCWEAIVILWILNLIWLSGLYFDPIGVFFGRRSFVVVVVVVGGGGICELAIEYIYIHIHIWLL